MKINGSETKGLAELNQHVQDEQKETKDGVVGEGQGISDEDESRIIEDNEDAKAGCLTLVHARVLLQNQQQQQQQSQGPVIRWERFLPVRSLKVLLVENDDSTRQVVSALLRNCSYEVTAVENGLQAWKILEDLTNHIDLVLTEVVMPCFSGIALLCKIMSHKTCKNIPMIMMSSNDSMSIVFKCLSKGAVDFLVKPIRKNELKNLWQHVWRKCHGSSGSGSESGIQTQKSVKSKSLEESDDNTGSNHDEDNGSISLNARDGSDNSSWTKRPVEVDSPQPMSPWDKLADPPDSTCAQVIHSRPEEFSNNWIPLAQAAEFPGLDDELENVPMGKDLEIGVPRDPNLLLVDQSKVLVHSTVAHKDKTLELDLERDSENQKGRKLEPNMEKNFELGILAVDLMSTMTKNTDHRAENQAPENQKGLSKISDIKSSSAYDKNEIPSLKLSLNRLRDGHTGNRNLDHNILRHSDLSAFSRYNTASTTNQAPTGNVGSCSPLDNSSEAAKTESMHNLQSSSNGTPNQRSNGSSNNNDMGSSTNNVFAKPGLSNERPVSKPAIKCLQPSAFQPVQNGHVSSSQSLVPGKADTVTTNTGMAQPRGKNQQLKPQHHHHHYHHHHHSLYNLQQQQQQLAEHDELSLENMAAVATQCGSSNILSTGIEGNAGCYSLNGSNSGSNRGSNGQNCNAAVNAGPNMENDNLAAVKDGPSGGRSGVDQSCFSQREAGLNKFRQKRKERCFEKKVRYHSRKRMAEQRPRVRGQFVRQAAQQTRSKDADC